MGWITPRHRKEFCIHKWLVGHAIGLSSLSHYYIFPTSSKLFTSSVTMLRPGKNGWRFFFRECSREEEKLSEFMLKCCRFGHKSVNFLSTFFCLLFLNLDGIVDTSFFNRTILEKQITKQNFLWSWYCIKLS